MNPYTNDNEALPVPGVHPLEAPTQTIQVNGAWIPYIVGALEFMRRAETWAGTATEVNEAVQQAEDLVAAIAGA